MTGMCSSRSKSHQSSSLTNPTERSFVPSMASSLPSAPNKAPSSVCTSPSAKRNSVGSRSHHGHSDIKRLPLGTAGRPPGSLLADAYGLDRFQSIPAATKACCGGSSFCDYDDSSSQREGGRHGNSLNEKKKAELIVVIDEDEGEQSRDKSRHQTRRGKSNAFREPRETPPDMSEGVVGGIPSGASYSYQNEPKGGQRNPLLKELKEVRSSMTKSSPLTLNKFQDAMRSGSKERKEDTQTASRGVAAAPVHVSAGETPDSTGKIIYHKRVDVGKYSGADLRDVCVILYHNAVTCIFILYTTKNIFQSDNFLI